MRLPVSTDDAAALEARTEGWIAGLQLAALSVRAGEDASSFVAAFGRSHRHILEYLGEEVLAHQPRPIQTFLLRTSVLDQLNGPLCEAVLADEQPEGGVQAMLDLVERANLFLVPFDAERRWYRYHQLFADLLRGGLHETEPGLTPALHRRASRWYEAHELLREAIHHALAARDHDGAVDRKHHHLRRCGRSSRVLRAPQPRTRSKSDNHQRRTARFSGRMNGRSARIIRTLQSICSSSLYPGPLVDRGGGGQCGRGASRLPSQQILA
jgi:hypothetical protein